MSIQKIKSGKKYPVIKIFHLLLPCIFILLLSIFSNGCGCNFYHAEDIYFPVQSEPQGVGLEALAQGELFIDDGCLKLHDNTIIWPYGYSLEEENEEIWVCDDTGRKRAKPGDRIKLSGGQIYADTDAVEKIIGQKLPDDIDGDGSFWLMNSESSVTDDSQD